MREDSAPRGRAGQALRTWANTPAAENEPEEEPATKWNRIGVSRGIELHLREDHPLARQPGREREIADAIRLAVARVLSRPGAARPGPERVETDSEPERSRA